MEVEGRSDRLGQVIAGKYRLERELGAGGAGTVYRAIHMTLGRPVALKLLKTEHLTNDRKWARFHREARRAAALSHPGIVEIRDFGVDEEAGPYLEMELLEGVALDELLERRERLDPEIAVHIAVQLLEALTVAHAAGVVHRDVKPANVFVALEEGGPRVKLVDFGVARLFAAGIEAMSRSQEETITKLGAIVGTVAYMSPEQLRSDALDGRADLYGVGGTLFHMLTGRPPLSATSVMEGFARLAAGEVERSVRAIQAELPETLDACVREFLHNDRARRFGSTDEALEALRALELHRPDQARSALRQLASKTDRGEPPDEPRVGPSTLAPPGATTDEPMASQTVTMEPSADGLIADGFDRSEAMRHEDAARTRVFAWLGVGIACPVLAGLSVLEGDPFARQLHAIGLGQCLFICAAIGLTLRQLERYRVWHTWALVMCCGLAIVSSYYFWGIFSSAMMILPVYLYFASGFRSRGLVTAAFVVGALPHIVLGTAIATRLYTDRGLVNPTNLSPIEATVVYLLAVAIMVVTYIQAAQHRRATENAMAKLEIAAHSASRRQAQLQEVKAELDRALAMGGQGRYSDQTVGDYRLGSILGRGAMGEVYEARHEDTGDPAAVKLLNAAAAGDRELVERFRREVNAVSGVRCPHIVRVIDAPDTGDGLPFLIMERLRGSTLAEILRGRPRLAPKQLRSMVSEVCLGLEAAHSAGIVHRDIKPGNLFEHREPGGRALWKVLDFGIARLEHMESMTGGQLLGTPSYMAPEQVAGGDVDPRTDVYSFGVVLYRSLTGHPAFAADQPAAILYKVTHEMPVRPGALARVGSDVERLLALCLAKDPAARFQSAADLAAAYAGLFEAGSLEPGLARRADAVLAERPWRDG